MTSPYGKCLTPKKNVTKLWVEQRANKGNASLKTEQYRRKDKEKRLRYGLALSTNNFSHIARSIPIIRGQKCTVSYLASEFISLTKSFCQDIVDTYHFEVNTKGSLGLRPRCIRPLPLLDEGYPLGLYLDVFYVTWKKLLL